MPSHVSRRRAHNVASPFLHGVQEGLFPRFTDTMGRSDSQPPVSPRFVAFAWRYHRLRRGLLPAIATHDRGHRGVDGPGPEPELTVETTGSPRFLGNPNDHWPCSPTPVGSFTCCGSNGRVNDAAPAYDHNEGSRHLVFSGLNHTVSDLAVYASQ